MPIGIGAGLNLGAMTVYLFADASGMRRGFNDAQRQAENFQQRMQKASGQLATVNTAQQALAGAVQRRDQLAGQQFIELQKRVADAQANASRTITQSYNERNRAVNQHLAVVRQNDAAIKQSAALEKQFADKIVAARKRLADAEKAGASARSISQRQRHINKLEAAEQAAIKQTASLRKKADQEMAASARQRNEVIEKANAREKQSITQLRTSVTTLVSGYRNLADQAGGQFRTLADRVEASGNRIIAAEQRIANARNVLINAQAARRASAVTTGEDYDKLVRNEERATRAVNTALNERRRARVAMASAERNFTVQFDEEVKKRSDSLDRERKKFQEAARAEKEARNQQRAFAQDRLSSGLIVATAAGAAVVRTAVKEWANYEEALRKALSVSAELRPRMKDAENAISDLSTALGIAPADIAAGFETVAQAGITQFEQAMEITRVATEGAAAGATSVETAVRPLIGVMNAYGEEAGSVREVSDLLFKAVTDGVFSFEDLASQLGDNISIAKSLDIELDQLLSAYVILTRRSNNLSESTTQVNAVMNAFLKPSAALQEAIHELTGETAQFFIRNHDLGEVLQVVSQLLEDNADAAGQLFPNIRALRGIYGLTADEASDFREELGELEKASDGAGATAEVLGFQMQGTAFQLRQAREEARQAAISLGQSLAPGILLVAKAIGGVASIFTAFNNALLGIPGTLLGAGVALTATALVYIRLRNAIHTAGEAIATLNPRLATMIARMRAGAVAARLLTLAISPIGITLGVLAFAVHREIQNHRKNEQAIKDLRAAYESLDETMRSLRSREDLTDTEVEQLEALRFNLDYVVEAFDNAVNAIDGLEGATDDKFFIDLGNGTYQWATAVDDAGNVISTQIGTFAQLTDWMTDAGFQTEELIKLITDFESVLNTTDLDINKTFKFLDPFIQAMKSGTPESAEALAGALTYVTDNIHEFKIEILETDVALTDLGESNNSLSEFFGTAADRAEQMRDALKGASDAARLAAGVLFDLSSPLAFIQQQLGLTGTSIEETILALQQMGSVNLDTGSVIGLEAAAEVARLQREIDKLTASFDASDNVINYWQGIISRTEGVVGTAADGFSKLDEMVRRNKISQEQANEIQEAAIFLNQRAGRAIEDEQVSIAKSLPQLAAFVKEHDLASQNFDNLSDAQKGFALALKDTTNQTVILTAVMLKLANAMNPDAVPTEFLDTFLSQIIAVNPEAAALLDTLDLIPERVRLKLEMQTNFAEKVDEAGNDVDKIDALIADLRDDLEEVNIDAGGRKSLQAAELRRQIELLTEKKRRIELELDTSDIDRELGTFESGLEDIEESASATQQRIQQVFDRFLPTLEEITEGAANSAESILEMSGAIVDLNDPISFLNASFGTTNKNALELLQIASDIGILDFTLTAEQDNVVDLVQNLQKVQARIAELEDGIQNNEQDMAMWQGRIDLVNDTIGISEERFAELAAAYSSGAIGYDTYVAALQEGVVEQNSLNDLVAQGRLTQEEANDATEAAIFLRERSLGGLKDEQAEQAKNLILLADYVKQHDEADGALKSLTPEQQQFAAAIQDTNTQMQLMLFLWLKLLEAMDAIDVGTADKLLARLGDANPVLQGILDDLNLIEDADPQVTINLDGEEKVSTLADELDRRFPKEGTTRSVEVNISELHKPGTPARDPQPSAPSTGESARVPLSFEEDPGSTAKQVVETALADAEPEAIPITFEEASAGSVKTTLATTAQDAVVLGTLTGQAFSANVGKAITDNASLVTDGTTELKTTLAEQESTLSDEGTIVGNTYDEKIGRAIIANLALVTDAISINLLQAISGYGPTVWNTGFDLGWNFDQGVAAGITSGTAASNAAAGLAARIRQAFENEDEQASPSRVGMRLGVNHVRGIIIGLQKEGDNAVKEAESIAGGIRGAFEGQFANDMRVGLPLGPSQINTFPRVDGVAVSPQAVAGGNIYVSQYTVTGEELAGMLDDIRTSAVARDFVRSLPRARVIATGRQ